MRKTWPDVAGFEDRGRTGSQGVQVTLEADKGLDVNSSRELPE